MIAAPAVDLKGGRCVQLVGGDPAVERVSLPDPVAAAGDWHGRGFGALHVVDLDAALGTGDNLAVIERILRASPAETQVGGGIRDDVRADALISAGASRIVVGTRALDDPGWLARLTARHPGRVTVALDVRRGRVLRRGWTEAADVELEEVLDVLSTLPLAAVLSTDVDREGRLGGIDRTSVTSLIERSPHPLWVSGGVTTLDDLAHLERACAAGAVLGMALYTGRLDADAVARRWGTAGASAPATEPGTTARVSHAPRGARPKRTDRTRTDR